MFKVYFSCIFQLFLLKLYYGKAIYICLDVIVVSCVYCHNWNLSQGENLFSSNYDKQRLERKITFSYNISFWSLTKVSTALLTPPVIADTIRTKKFLSIDYKGYAYTCLIDNDFRGHFRTSQSS